MNRIIRFITIYLLLTGAFLHAAACYVYLFEPPLYQKVKSLAIAKIKAKIPILANMQTAKIQNYDLDQEIQLNFGTWQPLENYPSAQLTRVVYSDEFSSLTDAGKSLKSGDTLFIRTGTYQSPLVLNANDIAVIGQGHVVIERTNAEGKAAIVIKGNYTKIANIECRHIEVADGNGACIRLEGKNLDLDHVYFHSSEQGLISGSNTGKVLIQNSRLEKLGHRGYAHGIYIGGPELHIENSLIIAAKDEGHEIKSRAITTTIKDSIISYLSSNDSRLIDISNGGDLKIKKTLLHQGPRSENQDLIGYGLEKPTHPGGTIVLERNTIFMERSAYNQLLHIGNLTPSVKISDNLIIGENSEEFSDQNIVFNSRKSAGIPEYPSLTKAP